LWNMQMPAMIYAGVGVKVRAQSLHSEK